MIVAKEIRNYGAVSISKWTYYDVPPDCANSGKNRICYEVYDNAGNLLDAFTTYKAAKKFAQRYILENIPA